MTPCDKLPLAWIPDFRAKGESLKDYMEENFGVYTIGNMTCCGPGLESEIEHPGTSDLPFSYYINHRFYAKMLFGRDASFECLELKQPFCIPRLGIPYGR